MWVRGRALVSLQKAGDSDLKFLLPQVQNDQCQPNADDSRWMKTTEKGWEFHSVSIRAAFSLETPEKGPRGLSQRPQKRTKDKGLFLPVWASPPLLSLEWQEPDNMRML